MTFYNFMQITNFVAVLAIAIGIAGLLSKTK